MEVKELLKDFNTPPFMTVGSKLVLDKILATSEVVVVFP